MTPTHPQSVTTLGYPQVRNEEETVKQKQKIGSVLPD